MSKGDLVVEFIETLEGLKDFKRVFFHRSAPIRGSAMRLLIFLHHHAGEGSLGIQPSELGNILQLTRPTITSLVNNLEEMDLVERLAGDEDRRVVFVRLTPQGAALVEETRARLAQGIRELMDYLGEDDGTELLRILRRMREFIREKETKEEGKQGPCGS